MALDKTSAQTRKTMHKNAHNALRKYSELSQISMRVFHTDPKKGIKPFCYESIYFCPKILSSRTRVASHIAGQGMHQLKTITIQTIHRKCKHLYTILNFNTQKNIEMSHSVLGWHKKDYSVSICLKIHTWLQAVTLLIDA